MSSQKSVHNRIHTLRGEQFRHLQNLRGSRSHLTSSNIHTVPSLPLRLLSLADPTLNLTINDPLPPLPQPKSTANANTRDSQPDGTSPRPPAGPTPPKSWRLNTRKDIRESATWRAEALSLVLGHPSTSQPSLFSTNQDSSITHNPEYPHPPSRVPPLSLLCSQLFLTTCTTLEFRDEIAPYLPSHLRKDIIRFTSVHYPLSSARLYALWGDDGHADGEMIVVGPGATLKDDYFIRTSRNNMGGAVNTGIMERDDGGGDRTGPTDTHWDWDADDMESTIPLSTLILLNTTLSSSTLFSLPPTLTHLALINLSSPVPLHRLPRICPLLKMLDLSYNSWLGANFIGGISAEGHGVSGILGEPQQSTDPAIKAIVDLGRIDWSRWNHLKVLGFRGNYIPEDFAQRVNEGRWDDVEIVSCPLRCLD